MLSGLVDYFIDTTKGYKERPVKVAHFVANYNSEGKNILSLPDAVEVKIYVTLK